MALATLLRPLWRTAEDEDVCDVCGPLDGTGREVFGFVSEEGCRPIRTVAVIWNGWNSSDWPCDRLR